MDGHLAVPSFFEKPTEPPAEFVLVEKTGGARKNYLDSGTFAFQSYADSMFAAAQLNESVKQVVNSLITLDEIAWVRLNTDYNFTDTTTKKYRYQAIFDIGYY
jgi:hypothetical protein